MAHDSRLRVTPNDPKLSRKQEGGRGGVRWGGGEVRRWIGPAKLFRKRALVLDMENRAAKMRP